MKAATVGLDPPWGRYHQAAKRQIHSHAHPLVVKKATGGEDDLCPGVFEVTVQRGLIGQCCLHRDSAPWPAGLGSKIDNELVQHVGRR